MESLTYVEILHNAAMTPLRDDLLDAFCNIYTFHLRCEYRIGLNLGKIILAVCPCFSNKACLRVKANNPLPKFFLRLKLGVSSIPQQQLTKSNYQLSHYQFIMVLCGH